MKSPRETIEYIAQHLAKQNMIAMDVDGACQYRGTNGSMCAIGCLITDEQIAQYDVVADDGVSDLATDILDTIALPTDLLQQIQHYHDGNGPDNSTGYYVRVDVGTEDERYTAILTDLLAIAEEEGVTV